MDVSGGKETSDKSREQKLLTMDNVSEQWQVKSESQKHFTTVK